MIMKKILMNSILAVCSIILLAACQSNSGVDPDDVIEEAFEKREEVGSYYLHSYMEVDMDMEEMAQNQTAVFKGVIDEEGNEASLETLEASGDQETEGGVIFVEDNVAYNLENGEWQKYDQDYGDIREAGTTYYEIIAAVKEFDEHAEKTKEDGSYKATFEGPATDVFDIFEEVFNLSLTGFDREKETTMNVDATFDEDSLHLTELNISIIAESDIGKISLIVDTTFDDFDEAKVELPAEIEEDAE